MPKCSEAMTEHRERSPLRLSAKALHQVSVFAVSYEAERRGYGFIFRQRLDEALSRIDEYPESFQRVNHRYRRALLQQFPFVVVYRMKSDHVEVVDLLPTRADPARMSRLTGHNTATQSSKME